MHAKQLHFHKKERKHEEGPILSFLSNFFFCLFSVHRLMFVPSAYPATEEALEKSTAQGEHRIAFDL